MFEGINSIKHINSQGTEPARVLSKDEVYHGAGLGWLETGSRLTTKIPR